MAIPRGSGAIEALSATRAEALAAETRLVAMLRQYTAAKMAEATLVAAGHWSHWWQ